MSKLVKVKADNAKGFKFVNPEDVGNRELWKEKAPKSPPREKAPPRKKPTKKAPARKKAAKEVK